MRQRDIWEVVTEVDTYFSLNITEVEGTNRRVAWLGSTCIKRSGQYSSTTMWGLKVTSSLFTHDKYQSHLIRLSNKSASFWKDLESV